MAEDHLGLFDKMPDRRQVSFSLTVVALLLVALAFVLPVRDYRLPEVAAFIPIVASIIFVADLITATLLYGEAAVFRSRALTVVGATYIYSALLLIPFVLTFPGAFSADGLLAAGVNTTSWIALLRRTGFPVGVLLYVHLRKKEFATQKAGLDPTSPGKRTATLSAIALALAVTVLATLGHGLLPPFYSNRVEPIYSYAVIYEAVFFAFSAVAMVTLFRSRRSSLDVWMLVAFSGGLIQSLLILTLQSRFTAGWYWLYIVNLISHLVLMLVLIAESNRLYTRLLLVTKARNRERDARLMSLDAVAAAISHEVGQPLTAIRLLASAARKRLASAPTDAATVNSLDAILEAAHRTSEVTRSVQEMFAPRPVGGRTELDLTEVVRATVVAMDGDFAAHSVSVQLILQEPLPPVKADPVQIQRVLVNLLTNAIESVGAEQHRPRRISIRSRAPDREGVLLEVSDNGGGIAPEAMDRIFDVFFTTKATGTGLGLALCRIIVEACGGRLWASVSKEGGATFYMRLPCSDLAAR